MFAHGCLVRSQFYSNLFQIAFLVSLLLTSKSSGLIQVCHGFVQNLRLASKAVWVAMLPTGGENGKQSRNYLSNFLRLYTFIYRKKMHQHVVYYFP